MLRFGAYSRSLAVCALGILMVGDELITLRPVETRTRKHYRQIWRALAREPEHASRFGNLPTNFMTSALMDRFHTPIIHKFLVRLGEKRIGVAAIEHDEKNGVSFIVLGLLEEFRGRKLGTVASRLLLRHCFTELNARRVETTALSSNPASIQMQDGMIHEGTLVGRFMIDDAPVDELLFRLMRSEWRGEKK